MMLEEQKIFTLNGLIKEEQVTYEALTSRLVRPGSESVGLSKMSDRGATFIY